MPTNWFRVARKFGSIICLPVFVQSILAKGSGNKCFIPAHDDDDDDGAKPKSIQKAAR